MDETGYLREGQIHVAWINDRGLRVIHTGPAAITRSPTNHPGDIQLAAAVDVPKNSVLRELDNCVIFSQHGARDLPSQLGGGDLDGDLYDVFWDHRIMPEKHMLHKPADYPRVPAQDIGRQVTIPDMGRHFIDFMKNDNVGILASQLLALSDRLPTGTKDENCIQICEAISTALDYPKTGIVVSGVQVSPPGEAKVSQATTQHLFRFDKSWKPDFMAPGPKVKIEEMEDPLSIVLHEPAPTSQDDPVASLDPNERKTRYYPSPNILGKLYNLVDEKGFYEQLQEQSKAYHRGKSAIFAVLDYVRRATVGFDFQQHLNAAREIRKIYEDCIEEISYTCALHPSHPLHEIEIVTGAVLGSIFNHKMREQTKDMRERFGGDVTYVRDMIRGDDEEDVPRSVACLYIGVKEKGKKVGRHGETNQWSFQYVAAAACLEAIERMNGGRLPDV